MPRPELQAPPEIFYNESEASKYTTSSRIVEIQARISERALELLALPNDGVPRLLLDVGCGSGLSGETLSENGHHWIGYDIPQPMLDVALEREVEGDLMLGDMGQVGIYDRNRPRKKSKVSKNSKGREWVLKKKEQMRNKGNTVPPDTKYTARKRKSRF